jgi:hypothetical protein
MSFRSRVVWAPLAAALAVRLGLLAASLAGHPWLWDHEPLNMSEAAAYHDTAEVARLLAAGANPNTTYLVRRRALRGRLSATPLEVARIKGRSDIEHLLIEAGATK